MMVVQLQVNLFFFLTGFAFRLLQTDGQMKKRGVKRVNSGRRISRTIRGELKVSKNLWDIFIVLKVLK